jgi:hypothetical protein
MKKWKVPEPNIGLHTVKRSFNYSIVAFSYNWFFRRNCSVEGEKDKKAK